MFTSSFWQDVAERAIATFAQTIIALVTVGSTDLVTLDWYTILITSLIAGALAVAKALAAQHFGEDNASIVSTYTYNEVSPPSPVPDAAE
jgi:Putative lactococcus lactis phage r1t holin